MRNEDLLSLQRQPVIHGLELELSNMFNLLIPLKMKMKTFEI